MCVLGAGVLSTAAASGSPHLLPGPAQPAAVQVPGVVGQEVTIARVGAVTDADPATLEQIFALLERAERDAQESGRPLTPEIRQAAAELGMLLTAYLAQHPEALPEGAAPVPPVSDAVSVPQDVAHEDDLDYLGDLAEPDGLDAAAVEPVVDGADGEQAGADDGAAGAAQPAEPAAAAEPAVPPAAGEPADGAPTGPGAAPDGVAADGPVPDGVAPEGAEPADGTDAPAPEEGAAEDGHDHAHDHERDEVTFEDVVVAAMRLAELLDPANAFGVSVTVPGGALVADTPLTRALRDVVARYGQSTAGYSNGMIPDDVLCALPFAAGHKLRCDAAERLIALNEAFRAEFGRSIPITDSYRTLESQIRLKAAKPVLAATPGYSNHGWGLAVDLGAPISTGLSPEYRWLRLHGPDYGWDNPAWARLDGSKPEPWHFEFFASGPVPHRALSPSDIAWGSKDPARSPLVTAEPAFPPPAAAPDAAAPAGEPAGPPVPAAPPVGPPSVPPTTTPTPGAPRPAPSGTPTPTPSGTPTPAPRPTPSPSPSPTSPTPSPSPSAPAPSPSPSPSPTPTPSDEPTPEPSDEPTATPSDEPTSSPSPTPTPSDEPSDEPGDEPAPAPTVEVPGVAGRSEADVRAAFEAAGLVLVIERSGEVEEPRLKTRAPGEKVPAGSTVTVLLPARDEE
ncbi:hypothetical protein DNL40_09580 [Xylanimonas oleitrophica]|uniref:D-alanyl-D-alanine carboxypeptidase-like core domain-containing protein n=1 Tax=Xylanimonas oleitrophica TaxID=2607479 RepID=A0A2W5WP27_9MICO|nr:hypothetical protein DNL40_09580 [Xylanimonas oleitrophica]